VTDKFCIFNMRFQQPIEIILIILKQYSGAATAKKNFV